MEETLLFPPSKDFSFASARKHFWLKVKHTMQPPRTNTRHGLSRTASKSTLTGSKGPSLPSSPSKRSREGDALWLRVMETKENQWRFLHMLALHEMSVHEREACAQLDALSTRLDELLVACDQTDRVVRRCRAHRFRQRIVRVASKPIQQAAAHLSSARYLSAANDFVDAHSALPTDANVGDLVAEIDRFRQQAERFRRSAADAGVLQLTTLADTLENLASTVTTEATAVVDAANQVNEAAKNAETARSKLLTDIIQQKPVALPADMTS